VATSRELDHPDLQDLELTQVLFALSDPARLEIVRQLAAGPLTTMSCQEVGPEMPKSTRSHHLKTLREAGLIRNQPQGRERLVSLRRDELEARFPGLLAAVAGVGAAPSPARGEG
jgi:DNA-binding transcriptional ArsR family regulator